MKQYYLIMMSLVFVAVSCIPVRIAPKIEGGQIYKPKKFHKQLPQQYAYVFEDPKDANEFFQYINAKFQTNYQDDVGNIPVRINNNEHYLTFYEIERRSTTINLVPIMVDGMLEREGYSPVLDEVHESRSGTWYIALTVTDEQLEDNLNPKHSLHEDVIGYVEAMRKEYLTTAEYIEIFLKQQ